MKLSQRREKIKILTKERKELRDRILKPKPKKEKPLPPPPKITTRNEYMNNCMFWINRFEKGECDKQRHVEAVTHLRDYCNQIIKENK